jgi:crossover junction endodeoxyribonuclease RuvC
VLGIDPGSVLAGWGLVRQEGNRVTMECAGVFRPPKCALPERLAHLHRELCLVLDAHRPDAVAVEAVFHARHARSALVLGHARGVLLLAAAQRDLPIFEYAPAAVKKAVTGDGSSQKEQVRKMVELLLGATLTGPMDQSDALAVAICHAQVGRFQGRLAELERAAGSKGSGGSRRHPALKLKLKGGS